MNASAEDAERQVEASRARLDETVDALKEKLTPGQVFDQMSRSFAGSSGGELLANFGSQVRENPLPLALIGAGVALLAMKSPPTRPGDHRGADHAQGLAKGDGRGAADGGLVPTGLKDQLQARAAAAGEAAGALADKVQHSVGQASECARSGVDSAKHTLARYGGGMAEGFQGLLEREPLVVAALGLAFGAAIGAALPPSSVEDSLLGPARDDLVGRGQSAASGAMATVKAAADDVASNVAQALTSHDGDDRSLGEKIGQAAQTAADTVTDHVQDIQRH